MSRMQCYMWFKSFKEGKRSVGADLRAGRPSTSIDVEQVQKTVIRGYRCSVVREVADLVGVSTGSCHQILAEKVQIHRKCAKFVAHLLTNDQKEKYVKISQGVLAWTKGHRNVLMTLMRKR